MCGWQTPIFPSTRFTPNPCPNVQIGQIDELHNGRISIFHVGRLQLDAHSHTVLSMDSLVAVYDLAGVWALAFVACYLSERLTSVLLEADSIFYECAWYDWPTTRHRNLLVAIRQAHAVFRLKSSGFNICSVGVLLKVNYLI